MQIDIKPNKNLKFLWGSLKDRLVRKKNISWLLLEGSSRSGKFQTLVWRLGNAC